MEQLPICCPDPRVHSVIGWFSLLPHSRMVGFFFIILRFAKYQVGRYVTKLLGQTVPAYHLISLLKEEMELLFWVLGTSLVKRETQGLDLTVGITNTSFYRCMFSTSRLLRKL